jgi:hypothetical protein
LSWIETNGWLIQDQHLWLVEQSLAQPNSLTHAFGKIGDISVGAVNHMHYFQHIIHPIFGIREFA